jgi:hypothetical protein
MAGPAIVHPDEWLPLIFAGQRPRMREGSRQHRAVQAIFHPRSIERKSHPERVTVLINHVHKQWPWKLSGASWANLRSDSIVLDGEAVVCGPDEVADFALLHAKQVNPDAILYAFDLLRAGRYGLTGRAPGEAQSEARRVAREAAARQVPDAVRMVITLGSPFAAPNARACAKLEKLQFS